MNTDKPKNHFKRWAESDDAKLRLMQKHGMSTEKIAGILHRTPATIHWRLWKLKFDDVHDEMAESLAAETSVLIPIDTPDEHEKLNNKKSPIEMIERRFLFGLITIVRFKYADD